MPLLLSNNGIDIFLWNLRIQNNNYRPPYAFYYNSIKCLLGTLIKFIFGLNLFKYFCLSSPEGLQQRKSEYGSLDDTIITIEADESTPLLVDRALNVDRNNNRKNNDKKLNPKKPAIKCELSSWSFEGSNQSYGSDYTIISTKSFKSHFTEVRVLAFALILILALSIAIYLLVIESRLPSITLSLDLVSHDIWSHKVIPTVKHLQHHNVDHIILMQTGNRNCDTSGECLKVLKEMQNKDFNQPEELPYNFLIGGDDQVYEVRGWEYPSSMKGVPQEKSLVIGIIGNFDHSAPKRNLLQTALSLIQESSKRRMVNTQYHIYGLRRNDHDRKEGEELFNEIRNWPTFKSFLYQP